MAWALLELSALTDEERFRTVALTAIDYEQSLFSPEAENWFNLGYYKVKTMRSSFGNLVRLS
jgi:hypothetical protein